VINVKSVVYDEKKHEDPFTYIPNLLLQEPNVLAFTDPTSGSVIDQMVNLSAQGLLIISRIHGKHCLDALVRFLAHKPQVKKLAEELQSVVCMRVLRKLCPECRMAFTPSPQLLGQFGIPADRVRQFYKAFEYEPGMVDEDDNEIDPCKHCSGIGYRERTGIFEVLTVTNPLRRALFDNSRLDNLMAVARSHGHVSMRDMGVVAVAAGVTSLDEVQRVLMK
jgi:type II secretory ATPase GspE/PulE/Tfp pilus assembly ATPase PilB-like protein